MAVLRLGHFRAGPAGPGEMLTSHATPGAAVEDALSRAHRHAAGKGRQPEGTGGAGTHPPARSRRCRRARHPAGWAAFSPAKGIATGRPEVVDA
jgi:hypothetical protein